MPRECGTGRSIQNRRRLRLGPDIEHGRRNENGAASRPEVARFSQKERASGDGRVECLFNGGSARAFQRRVFAVDVRKDTSTRPRALRRRPSKASAIPAARLAANRPTRSSSHRFDGDVSGSLILRRAGSWMNGALQANGSGVSTPVGSTTYRLSLDPRHNLDLAGRELVSRGRR